jgi:FlaA1/EpsC-like NDP-sugar epimerase
MLQAEKKNTMAYRAGTRQILKAVSIILLIGLSLIAAFELRFDFAIPSGVVPLLWQGLLLVVPVKLSVFYVSRFHRNLRAYAEIADLSHLLAGNLVASALFVAEMWFIVGRAFPRSIYLIDFLVSFLAIVVVWFSTAVSRVILRRPASRRKGILIYGAGWAGATLLNEIRASRSIGYEVIGFLDDDPSKRRADIMGTPVLGLGSEAASVVARLNCHLNRVEEVVIAIPSASGAQKRQALANCQATGVPCKTIPGIADLLEREVLVSQIRNLSVADLLGRPPVQLDEEPVAKHLAGRCVLITGAGGSIGSELCRQVARMRPSRLVALDQAESDLFRIHCELHDKYPELDLVAALGDIRNPERIADVFDRNPIDSVFHAAAYKHVPMMESHILEAVENNILGTWNLVNAVRDRHVPRFLMISSDKAVNPTSVMGATKRACELIVAAAPQRHGGTSCVSVRFGNVLGSNGSVVPIFQAQIAAGGPVRVTHADIERYFMTTAEAVSLLLQASSMGTDSEVFVLNMGEPVRIVDLAVNMIRLAGLVPYEDIDIEFTGLRPGEKLFEEINGASERMLPTYHDKIHIFQQAQPDWAEIRAWTGHLRTLLDKRLEQAAIEHLRDLVPEYRSTPVPAGASTFAATAGSRGRDLSRQGAPAAAIAQ